MTNKKFKLPKRVSELSKKPIEMEAMLLEQEYMKLLDNPNPTEYDEFLITYCHKRCNKIWKKIARRA